MHDLHESVPFLYTSTGTGPYNAWLDPIMVDEWQQLAYYEIEELTKRGLPGVWTHGFYDGWAPNYMMFDRATATTRSAASTRPSATAAPTRASAPCRPARRRASGTARIRRCPGVKWSHPQQHQHAAKRHPVRHV